MALAALKNNFVSKAVAAGLVATAAVTPLSSSFAQQAEMRQATFVAQNLNATAEACRWSLNNNGGVGVAVHLGTDREVTPAQIEQVIGSDFARHGISRLHYFYEQNDMPATGFRMCVDGESTNALTLGTVRQQIPTTAGDAQFMIRHPELAANRY